MFNMVVLTSAEGILLGSCGFHGDVLTVTKNIKAQMKVSAISHSIEHVACSYILNTCILYPLLSAIQNYDATVSYVSTDL